MAKEVWIAKAVKQKSGLRDKLNVPKGSTIPDTKLKEIKAKPSGTKIKSHGKTIPVTTRLKRQANLALTLKKLRTRKEHK